MAKKPSLVEPPAPVVAPPAASVLFAPAEASPTVVAEAQRRILPCLVTEAAIDAAKVVGESDEALAPRKRGRPRKERRPEDLAPLAPRKRGRPRKTQIEVKESAPAARAPVPQPVRQTQPVAAAPVGASARSNVRRAAASELPRSERWKRRLPKALR
ncbi:MAG: hypothetical protein KDJ25_04255 [Rhodoblastus sp.]|nr:hypothetical protein [Rhodoblastus sp.]